MSEVGIIHREAAQLVVRQFQTDETGQFVQLCVFELFKEIVRDIENLKSSGMC